MKFLGRLSEPAYALLRLATGFLFCFHGAQKILGVFSQFRPAPFTQLWYGGLIELVGGFLVLTGLQTRAAAFLCSGTMAVAYFQFHWKGQWGARFFPAVNEGELAALYCFVFFFIACRGAGKWGLGKGD
ncbi:MAG TPA: DoxX family protein [Elusimicrobiota bacterium]|jgi:putative oxidoreductase|nr:DoxX family protein [Elusimicrobiota bacterium]HMZ26193.1 DoxX family protein [Elusimicrobiota bacterium]HNC75122.1 DoxX family protein [Elusimicrobiota bacterium]HND63983.1 DoxX family protein [Elusimicrobiota bacterium]HNF58820.1 DoxX family protein [Elusimicrobiota bacterium]